VIYQKKQKIGSEIISCPAFSSYPLTLGKKKNI